MTFCFVFLSTQSIFKLDILIQENRFSSIKKSMAKDTSIGFKALCIFRASLYRYVTKAR